jgi:hypothetical protein
MLAGVVRKSDGRFERPQSGVPILLAGKANGQLKGHQHLMALTAPHGQCSVTMLQLGIRREHHATAGTFDV